MNPESWKDLEALLDEALDLPDADRRAFLDRLGAKDPALCRAVEAFLSAEVQARGFLDVVASERAAALMQAMAEEEVSWDALRLEGETVGPYRIVRELGRGGMGAVFLAERVDGEFEQRVALKLVKRGMGSAEILERFRAERQILARLQHPHIARLMDGGASADGQPYFALEHVEGLPLDIYCDEAALPIEDRLRLFLQVCDAVEYAHRRLVVHRDLKPSNILVNPEGQAKLLDFGIAKVLGPSTGEGAAHLTAAEARPMTPLYAAPEQLLGQPVTTATDVYSLGVVLYEVLAGRHPYRLEGAGAAEIQRAALEQEPEPLWNAVRDAEDAARARSISPERLARRLRGDLENVVRTALRKEPERRYPSADAMADDLRRHLQGRPVSARPDTFAYRAAKFVGRHRLAVASAALVILSLVTGVVGTLWQARQAMHEARKAEEVKRFTLSLFEVSDPDVAKGKDLTARELLETAVRRIRSELATQPETEAEMLLVIGNVHHRMGLDSESRPLLERALELRRRQGDDLAIAETEMTLGGVYLSLGNFDRAGEIIGRALQRRESRLGRDHPETAFARGLLGRVRFEEGNFPAARSLIADALQVQRRNPNASREELAISLQVLGRVLHNQADLDGAERLFREAFEIRRGLFGDDHTAVSETMFNLAAVKLEKGDVLGAESYYRQVLAIDRRLLGPAHEAVANGLNNMGAVLLVKGSYVEAEGLFREALGIRRKVHGASSPQLAAGLHNLARALRHQGRLAEAEPLSRQAVGFAEALLGDQHVNVGVMREELARTLSARGKEAEAESLARSALDIFRTQLPADHPRATDALVTLGQVLVSAGSATEAEDLLREALRRRRARFGEADWRTAEARLALGECLMVMGRREEAGSILKASYEILVQQLGLRHPLALRAKAAGASE